MNRTIAFLLCLVAGYVVGAVTGYALVSGLSGNTHDRAVEAAMTAAFVTGPVGAVLAAAARAVWRFKR
jgi:hypothetical protein